jgi:hypothetical protein
MASSKRPEKHFYGKQIELLYCILGLRTPKNKTKAKNRTSRATQKQVLVARWPPTPRILISPPGRRSRRANPRGGDWGFGAAFLGAGKKNGAPHTNFGKNGAPEM